MKVSTPKHGRASLPISALAGLLTLSASMPQAQAASANEARFRITATWIINYVEPKPRSTLSRTTWFVTLKPNGTVEEQVEESVGNGWPGSSQVSRDTTLGIGGNTRLWKVVNETTIVRLLARNSHTFAIWLRTQGADSCTATLEWRLKPGFTLFEAPRKPGKPLVRFAEHSWLNARCDVL